MRHLFIINKHSGKGNAWMDIEAQLNKYSGRGDFEIHYTKSRGDATAFAREYVLGSSDFTRIYACGGDGTFNEVLSGVYDLNNCAIAVVPIGSGNDFIRSFGIEKEKYLDIDNLINGREVFVDLLKCGDRVSGNSITIGFDCAVAKNFVKFNKRKHISSELAYKLSIFYCIFKERVHNFTVITDGEKLNIDGTYLLSICAKGKYYGGGIKCAPLADNSDGYIDFTAIKTVGVLKFVSLLSTYVKGEHLNNPKIDFIINKKVKSVIYENPEPFEIGIDGEIVTVDRAEITLLEKAQRIVLPK